MVGRWPSVLWICLVPVNQLSTPKKSQPAIFALKIASITTYLPAKLIGLIFSQTDPFSQILWTWDDLLGNQLNLCTVWSSRDWLSETRRRNKICRLSPLPIFRSRMKTRSYFRFSTTLRPSYCFKISECKLNSYENPWCLEKSWCWTQKIWESSAGWLQLILKKWEITHPIRTAGTLQSVAVG